MGPKVAIRVTGNAACRGLRPIEAMKARTADRFSRANLAAVCFPLAQTMFQPALLVVGFLLIMGFLLLRLQKRSSQSGGRAHRPLPRRSDTSSYRHASQSPHADQWEVEMHELAREISGRVDSKLAVLQQLVMMLDERIVTLDEKLAQLHDLLAQLDQRPGDQPPGSSQYDASQSPPAE